MGKNIENRKIKERVYIAFSVIALLAYALHIVFKVVYSNIVTDIEYESSLLPDAVGMARDIVELVGMSACFSALIFCLYLGGVKNCVGALVIIGALTTAKNIIGSRSMINLMTGGGVSLKGLFNLSSFLIEILQYVILVLIVSAIMKKHRQRVLLTEKLARNSKSATGGVKKTEIYPFRKIFGIKNPVLLSVLWGGIIVFIFSMLSKLAHYVINAINFPSLILDELTKYPFGIALSFAQHLLTNLSRGAICYFAVLLLETVFCEWYYKEKLFK